MGHGLAARVCSAKINILMQNWVGGGGGSFDGREGVFYRAQIISGMSEKPSTTKSNN